MTKDTIQSFRAYLETAQGRELAEYMREQAAFLLTLSNVKDVDDAQELAIEVKAARKSYEKFRGALLPLLDLPENPTLQNKNPYAVF